MNEAEEKLLRAKLEIADDIIQHFDKIKQETNFEVNKVFNSIFTEKRLSNQDANPLSKNEVYQLHDILKGILNNSIQFNNIDLRIEKTKLDAKLKIFNSL